MIEKIEGIDGVSYRDAESNKGYLRIIGGFSWPGVKPGFVVVIGEDCVEDYSLKVRHLRLLAEVEDSDIESLFQQCVHLRNRYQVQKFLGDTKNDGFMNFLYQFNRTQKKGDYRFDSLILQMAAFPQDLQYHAYIIKERLQQSTKSLHLGEKSLLKGYLMDLDKDFTGGPLAYPAIMALGYCLSYFKNYPKDPDKDRLEKMEQRDSGHRSPFEIR